MNKTVFVLALGILFATTTVAYSASIMPFEKIETYFIRVLEYQKGLLSPKEMKLLNAGDITVFKKVYVQPLVDLGYNYSDTVEFYAKMIVNEEYPMMHMMNVKGFIGLNSSPAIMVKLLEDGTIKSTTIDVLKLIPEFNNEISKLVVNPSQGTSTSNTASEVQYSGAYKDFCGVWCDKDASEELVVLFFSDTECFIATRGGESDVSFPVKVELFNEKSIVVSFDSSIFDGEDSQENSKATTLTKWELQLKRGPSGSPQSMTVIYPESSQTFAYSRPATKKDLDIQPPSQ